MAGRRNLEEKTQINAGIWIGKRPTRRRAEAVAETGRKTNTEATVGGERDIPFFTTPFIDDFFPLLSRSCVTLSRKIRLSTASCDSACCALLVPHACLHCDFLPRDQFLAPSHILNFFFFFPSPGQSHTSHAHVFMRSTCQLRCVSLNVTARSEH